MIEQIEKLVKERNIKKILEEHENFFEIAIMRDIDLYNRYLDAEFAQGDFELICRLLEEECELYMCEEYFDEEYTEEDEDYDEFGVINYYREYENKLSFYDKREDYFSTHYVEISEEDLNY